MKFELDPLSQVRLLCAEVEAGDADRVRNLLAQGCAFAHPKVDNDPVALALSLRNAEIAEALLSAGANLPAGSVDTAFDTAIREDRPLLFNEALACRPLRQSDLDSYLHDAATMGRHVMGRQLLEMGANPRYTERGRSCFERAVDRGYRDMIDAMLAKLTQIDKDAMLIDAVKGALDRSVSALLAAGADPAQRVDGRTLLQLAPRDAEDVKRLLRAHKTGQRIEAAMITDDDPAPAKDSFTP